MWRAIVAYGLSFFALAAGARGADTVFLKSGDEIAGKITEESANTIQIRDAASGAFRSLKRMDVDTIIYDRKSRAPATAAPATAVIPPPPSAPTGGTPPTAPSAPAGGTVPTVPGVRPTPTVPGPPSIPTVPGTPPGGTMVAKPAEPGQGGTTEGAKGEMPPAPVGEGSGGAGAAGKADRPDWPKLKKEEQEFVDEIMQRLDTDDPSARGEAKAALEARARDLIGAVVDGLLHKRVEARAACAEILGNINARNAAKHLIEVFYAAMPEKGEAATYQVPFIRALKTALPRVTGETFINVEPDKSMVQDGLAKYIDWYNKNYDRLPPQVGEPKIDPTDPDYMKKLEEARKLKLEKRVWPRPPLSADIAAGATKGINPPPGATERPSDINYEKAFPKGERGSGAGYIRQGDQQYGSDFFKKK